MPGIFLSYRRADTQPWAGHLFDDLAKSFGASQVFMDINGGIPRGANFEQTLTTALAGCDALIALIGPQWTACKRSDGIRRLDVPADWVRNEIGTALRRKICVTPVLFGGARLPGTTELPEDLQPLLVNNAAEVTDTRWPYDVGELVKDLVRVPLLKRLYDIALINAGLEGLKRLIGTVPAVADAVSRSKEVIATTHREVGRLELFKTIHDSFHSMETRCLLPMRAGGQAPLFEKEFSRQARRIREAMHGRDLDPNLQGDILDALDSTASAFQSAAAAASDAAFERVINEFLRLFSSVPAALDMGIAQAAAGLNLDRLADLMARVRDLLAAPAGQEGQLKPLLQGIDGLGALNVELKTRVKEHGGLQRLDSKLRAVCDGETRMGDLAEEWTRIKQTRSRLVSPYSVELEPAIEELADAEREIEAALASKDEVAAQNYVRQFYTTITYAFQDVDRGLKELCLRLTAVSEPIKTILAMC